MTEQNNYKVRKVDIASTAVSSLVGSTTAGNVDGTGGSARLNSVYGIVTDGIKLYVAANIKIRKIE